MTLHPPGADSLQEDTRPLCAASLPERARHAVASSGGHQDHCALYHHCVGDAVALHCDHCAAAACTTQRTLDNCTAALWGCKKKRH